MNHHFEDTNMTTFVTLTDEQYAALAPIEKAQYKRQMNKINGVVIDTSPYGKLERNPNSLRARINAMCWQCSCEQRKEIALCAVKKCPLWDVRPYQGMADADDDTNINSNEDS